MSTLNALVIEDDPKLGIIFQTALRQAGFETSLDDNGDSWREKLAATKPALVLMDIHLPFALGTDIIAEIRATPEWKDLTVLIVTADLYRAKELQARGERVLLKPVGLMQLLEIIASLNIKPE